MQVDVLALKKEEYPTFVSRDGPNLSIQDFLMHQTRDSFPVRTLILVWWSCQG